MCMSGKGGGGRGGLDRVKHTLDEEARGGQRVSAGEGRKGGES